MHLVEKKDQTEYGWAASNMQSEIVELINEIANKYSVDRNRIAIMGVSRGGIGTWHFVHNNPDLFSAAVPISCGFYNRPANVDYNNFVSTPIWAICGEGNNSTGKDEAGYNRDMRRETEAINAAGGYAEFTSIPGTIHSTVESHIDYKSVFNWMLSQSKGDASAVNETILTYLPYDDKDRIVKRTTTKFYGTETTFDGKTVSREALKPFSDYINYYEILPEKMEKNLPLIVFLHGNGGCSGNCENWLNGNVSILNYIRSGKAYAAGNFVFIAPHAHSIVGGDASKNWEYYEPDVMELVESVVEEYKINKKRIIISGFSGGTQGVWAYVTRNPDYFAAAVPVSCSALEFNAASFTTTPTWAISGRLGSTDWETINGIEMEKYVRQINSAAGSEIARYDYFSGYNHGTMQSLVFNDLDSNVFDTQYLFEWMLQQEKGNPTGTRPGTTTPGIPRVDVKKGDKTFTSLVNANDPEALNHFSLDIANGLLWYATYTEEIVTQDGETVSSSYKIQAQSVDISSISSMCSIPFDFLFSLLQTSENPEWVMSVIDMALQESDIVIMIQDQVNVHQTTETYRQVLKTTEQKMDKAKSDSLTDGLQSTKYEFPYGETREETTTIYTNTATVYLRKAKTWCLDYEQEANIQTETSGGTTVHPYTNDDYEAAVDKTPFETVIKKIEPVNTIDDGITADFSDLKVRKSYIDNTMLAPDDKPYYIYTRKYIGELKESTKTYIKTSKCTINEKKKEINYERFLGTLKNDTGIYYKGSLFDPKGIEIAYKLPPDFKEKAYPARDITQSDDGDIDILLEMLLRHEDTQIHEQIMMYYWNIYTGKNMYDVNLAEILNFFNTSIMSTNSSNYKNIVDLILSQLRYWEGEGVRKTNSEGVVCYEAVVDTISSSRIVTFGSGLTVNELEYFAPYGITSIKAGDLIPVDIVDAVMEQVVKDQLENIKALIPGLKDYQYAALTIGYYNYPKMVYDFASTYDLSYIQSYDKYKKDIPYRMSGLAVKDSQANAMTESLKKYVDCPMYTDTWSTIYYSGGVPRAGLVRRRYYEWMLFQYGYDVVTDSYYSGIGTGGITTQEEADALTATFNSMLNTIVHNKQDGKGRAGPYQLGPYAEWWESPYNALQPFQCTWWANGRASMYLSQYGTKYTKYPTQYGNGGDYYAVNKQNGWFAYGSEPRPNSLISWQTGEYGHVAYVEGVTEDGLWISDAGSGVAWRGVRFISKEYAARSNGYIYLDEPL